MSVTEFEEEDDDCVVELGDLVKGVSLCHVTECMGPYEGYIQSNYPRWDECDLIKQYFEQLEIPDFVEQHRRIHNMQPDERKAALKAQATALFGDESDEEEAPARRISRRNKQEACRTVKRMVENDEGEMVEKEFQEPVSTPEFHKNLHQTRLSLESEIGGALRLYDELLAAVDSEGYVRITHEEKTSEKPPQAKGRTTMKGQQAMIENLRRANVALKRKLASVSSGSSGAAADETEMLQQLEAEKAARIELEAELKSLREQALLKDSKIQRLEVDLEKASPIKRAAVAQAQLEVMFRLQGMQSTAQANNDQTPSTHNTKS